MGKKVEYTNGELTIVWAAGNVPACRNLRKNVTQCLPPEREAVGTNRECYNGRANCTNQ